MKDFKDMDFTEKINWATGYLCLAIGEGKFKDAVATVATVIQMVSAEAFQRGVEERKRRTNDV